MNTKRWAGATVAGFAAIFVLDFMVHGKLLRGLYEETKSVWRGTDHLMWLMMLGQLLFAALFAFIYTKGYEANKPGLGQGLRYGLLIGILTSITYISVWYVVLPIPLRLAIGWVGSGIADSLVAGALVGLIYKK